MSAVERLAAAHDRLAEAIFDAGLETDWADPDTQAERVFAADPTLAADLELGAAWRAAEEALPPGGRFEGARPSSLAMRDQWLASYSDEGGWFNFYGPTPTAALRALKEALTK